MIERSRLALVALACVVSGSLSLAQEESRPASKPKQADIYDTKVDGKDLVAKALQKAVRDDKRVLLVFGGNWCGWCHKLHELFKKGPKVATVLRNEYEVAWIDLGDGKNPRNQDLKQSYADSLKTVPFLTVLDSTGKVLVQQATDPLEDGDHHDAVKVQEFLEKWKVAPKSADDVLAEAKARAKAESKMLFFHVGAPW
jgi:thioredoxin-related protein